MFHSTMESSGYRMQKVPAGKMINPGHMYKFLENSSKSAEVDENSRLKCF